VVNAQSGGDGDAHENDDDDASRHSSSLPILTVEAEELFHHWKQPSWGEVASQELSVSQYPQPVS
jgi:hypothetical protein